MILFSSSKKKAIVADIKIVLKHLDDPKANIADIKIVLKHLDDPNNKG